jgi:hypothetical protein
MLKFVARKQKRCRRTASSIYQQLRILLSKSAGNSTSATSRTNVLMSLETTQKLMRYHKPTVLVLRDFIPIEEKFSAYLPRGCLGLSERKPFKNIDPTQQRL